MHIKMTAAFSRITLTPLISSFFITAEEKVYSQSQLTWTLTQSGQYEKRKFESLLWKGHTEYFCFA